MVEGPEEISCAEHRNKGQGSLARRGRALAHTQELLLGAPGAATFHLWRRPQMT